MESVDPGKKLVGHNYAITFDLGNGRTIQVNGNLYVDDTLADMNQKLDHIIAVLERQRARAEVEILEAELKTRQKRVEEICFHIEQTQAQLAAHDAKERRVPADANARAQLVAAIENHKVNLKRMEPEVEEGRRNLEEGRKKAA